MSLRDLAAAAVAAEEMTMRPDFVGSTSRAARNLKAVSYLEATAIAAGESLEDRAVYGPGGLLDLAKAITRGDWPC